MAYCEFDSWMKSLKMNDVIFSRSRIPCGQDHACTILTTYSAVLQVDYSGLRHYFKPSNKTAMTRICRTDCWWYCLRPTNRQRNRFACQLSKIGTSTTAQESSENLPYLRIMLLLETSVRMKTATQQLCEKYNNYECKYVWEIWMPYSSKFSRAIHFVIFANTVRSRNFWSQIFSRLECGLCKP